MNRARLILFLIQGYGVACNIGGMVLVRELNPQLGGGKIWLNKQLAWICLIACQAVYVGYILWVKAETSWVECVFSGLFVAALTLFCNSYRMMLKELISLEKS